MLCDRRPPRLIAHADWSKDPAKRWLAAARFERGRYRAVPVCTVRDAGTLLEDLRSRAADGPVLVGFDFPIGVPAAYARRAGIEDFRNVLGQLGRGKWKRFFDIAETPAQISIHRPFYPYRPGGTRRAQLVEGLQLQSAADLHRLCERQTATRAEASSLFWTLGAKQAGRAAIAGWQEVLQPGLEDPSLSVAIWPFDGAVCDLLATHSVVVCETYPANHYGNLGFSRSGWSKRRPEDRLGYATLILSAAESMDVTLDPSLSHQVRDGFGPDSAGEDAFDAMVGLLSMIHTLRAHALDSLDLPAAILNIEGWMFGMALG